MGAPCIPALLELSVRAARPALRTAGRVLIPILPGVVRHQPMGGRGGVVTPCMLAGTYAGGLARAEDQATGNCGHTGKVSQGAW
jgi:hypothetical protein